MALYNNYYFKKLVYNKDCYKGVFSAPENAVACEFEYDRRTKQFRIWNNTRPVEDILPLPVWLLDRMLEQNGRLRSCERRLCY